MLPRVKTAALSLLRQGRTMDKYDVADTVFCHPKTAQRALSSIHGEGKARITAWRTVYKQHIPAYATGPGDDVAKPKALTAKQRSWRRRADPEVRIEEAMQKRAKRYLEKTHAC